MNGLHPIAGATCRPWPKPKRVEMFVRQSKILLNRQTFVLIQNSSKFPQSLFFWDDYMHYDVV